METSGEQPMNRQPTESNERCLIRSDDEWEKPKRSTCSSKFLCHFCVQQQAELYISRPDGGNTTNERWHRSLWEQGDRSTISFCRFGIQNEVHFLQRLSNFLFGFWALSVLFIRCLMLFWSTSNRGNCRIYQGEFRLRGIRKFIKFDSFWENFEAGEWSEHNFWISPNWIPNQTCQHVPLRDTFQQISRHNLIISDHANSHQQKECVIRGDTSPSRSIVRPVSYSLILTLLIIIMSIFGHAVLFSILLTVIPAQFNIPLPFGGISLNKNEKGEVILEWRWSLEKKVGFSWRSAATRTSTCSAGAPIEIWNWRRATARSK